MATTGAEKKRTASEAELQEPRAIVLDVEGTTTSISFVKDELFPYVREFLKKHVDEKWDTEEFKEDFTKLKEQAKKDEAEKIDGFIAIKETSVEEAKESLIKNILWQMDNDRKTNALKLLQGHMWRAAHKPIKGHVYDDVPKAFEEWTNSGKKLYIYSSGSVEAQKLLFGNSVHGDLLKYLSGHFDTEVGPKQESDSYKNILTQINHEPSDVLFLTDIIKEAEAAKNAGLSTAIVIREGNAKLTDEDKVAFKTINSFAELSFQKSQKRQKLDDPTETEKKDVPKEEKLTTVVESGNEAMDTSDSAVVDEKKKDEVVEDKIVVESKVENMEVDAEKIKEKTEKVTKTEVNEVIENAKINGISQKIDNALENNESENKTDKTLEKVESKVEEKKVEDSTNKVVDTANVEEIKTVAKEIEDAKAITDTVDEKVKDAVTEKIAEVTEKVTENSTETVTKKVIEPVIEKVSETVTDNVTEAVTEKVAEKVVENVVEKITEKETIPEVKPTEEVKENGETKIDESENKENIENTEAVKKTEPEIEVAEEAKEEIIKTKETEEKNKTEVETEKEVENTKRINGHECPAVFSNGVNQEIKENEDSEESKKVKKSVTADGAGESDVVTPPVVVAASS